MQPTAVPAFSAPPVNEDNDELDKEWVRMAKSIVEHTKSDPYLESSEISKAKAEFLRQRYNKHIKVADQ